ncbi:hypothetical protein IGI04_001728 [Brassica rapa subsp. trilocularis]|uniref:Uncharacterized protein n=1 Tax=Brassica rapa subsp. trilocularis TaxID=1813537 RepID=A0ABQ7NUC7_BRACM|nr:hypothetical protein IGI04_001728 [Brassica rapa subsp. trilocularis]
MSERHLFPELRIRSKMREIMIKEDSSCDLKELVANQDPKFDLGKKLKEALHGDYTAEDVDMPADEPTEIIGA